MKKRFIMYNNIYSSISEYGKSHEYFSPLRIHINILKYYAFCCFSWTKRQTDQDKHHLQKGYIFMSSSANKYCKYALSGSTLNINNDFCKVVVGLKTPDGKRSKQVCTEMRCPALHDTIQRIPGHHLALWIPDIWLWSAKWRKTIRLSRHLRFTPRGLEVIIHLLRILTGQLSLGNSAISLSATSCKKKSQYLFVFEVSCCSVLRKKK